MNNQYEPKYMLTFKLLIASKSLYIFILEELCHQTQNRKADRP